MPRRARQRSESGIYHIILRGINRQNIFEDEADNRKFLEVLQRYKQISEYELYAYCLMGNHVHILLHVGKEPLEQIMRRICGSFVYWYNKKYERVGNLFQDRFKSEPVEDDSYFLTVLRYIHQNPLKAGLVNNIGQYKWSSYDLYANPETKSILVDSDFVLRIFNGDSDKAVQGFIDFHKQIKDAPCLEIDDSYRISDQKALEIIRSLCKINNGRELQKIGREQRDSYLKQLKGTYKLSIRQIERLTGINRGVVFRA